MNSFYIKGDFISADQKDRLTERPDQYLLVRDGRIAGFTADPGEDLAILDHSGQLIIPSFTDIHVHAAQFPNMGLGMDMPLLPWLETYTFPLEMKYADPDYARLVYPRFVHALWEQGSLRSCIYASIHREATEILMDELIASGLAAYVGKVNMNRNAPEGLTESLEDSIADTRQWLDRYAKASPLVKPILTPRFVPSVTSELMRALGDLARAYEVPLQSHLNENRDEVAWVRELHPESDNYLDIYQDHDMIREHATIMAHCIYNEAEEVASFVRQGIFLAHCPNANLNMSSGIMPAAKLMRTEGINMALGTDVAGGHTLSIPQVMVAAMQSSNILFALDPAAESPLTLAEAFWMGTRGGGTFFGPCGDFNPGASCDLLIIDDSDALQLRGMSLTDRLSKFLFTGTPSQIRVRMLQGRIIPEPHGGR